MPRRWRLCWLTFETDATARWDAGRRRGAYLLGRPAFACASKSVSMALRRMDRCDVCPAAAVVLVQMVAGPLTFCGHHYDEHASALLWQALEVLDYRLPGR